MAQRPGSPGSGPTGSGISWSQQARAIEEAQLDADASGYGPGEQAERADTFSRSIERREEEFRQENRRR